jgi:hypothetical protein
MPWIRTCDQSDWSCCCKLPSGCIEVVNDAILERISYNATYLGKYLRSVGEAGLVKVDLPDRSEG